MTPPHGGLARSGLGRGAGLPLSSPLVPLCSKGTGCSQEWGCVVGAQALERGPGGVGEPRDLLAGVLEAPGSHPCCLETLKSLDLCLFPTPHVSGWGRRLIFHGARDFPGYIFSLGLTSASCSVSGDGLCTFPGLLIRASPSPWAPHCAVPSGIPGGDPWTTVGGAPWGQDVDTGRGVDGVVSWAEG